MLIVLTGSSGVGKNTVIDAIENNSDKYRLMPTYTTRQKRQNEKEGHPFFFITKEEFQEKIGYHFQNQNFFVSSIHQKSAYYAPHIPLIKPYRFQLQTFAIFAAFHRHYSRQI